MSDHEQKSRVWEAVIKVDTADPPERRASDIADGIGYACALLLDEYGWSAEKIAGILERVTDEITDQEAMRT